MFKMINPQCSFKGAPLTTRLTQWRPNKKPHFKLKGQSVQSRHTCIQRQTDTTCNLSSFQVIINFISLLLSLQSYMVSSGGSRISHGGFGCYRRLIEQVKSMPNWCGGRLIWLLPRLFEHNSAWVTCWWHHLDPPMVTINSWGWNHDKNRCTEISTCILVRPNWSWI